MKYELEFMKMSAFFETPSYVCLNYIAFQIAFVCRFSSFSAEGNVMNLLILPHFSDAESSSSGMRLNITLSSFPGFCPLNSK